MTSDRDDSTADALGPDAGAATEPSGGWLDPGDPGGAASCAACGGELGDRYGWCSGCTMALCFPCGRRHFCRSSCAVNGCRAGLCVREVRGGVLVANRWGLPSDDDEIRRTTRNSADL